MMTGLVCSSLACEIGQATSRQATGAWNGAASLHHRNDVTLQGAMAASLQALKQASSKKEIVPEKSTIGRSPFLTGLRSAPS